MTQTQWLVDYIAKAFAGVSLDGGIDIHAAQSMDDYGNPEEDQLSKTAERIDWRRVKMATLQPRFWGITFLDAQGFRFYAPAIMTELLIQGDETYNLSAWFLSGLAVSPTGEMKEVPFDELFNSAQRAAIIRYLKHVVHNDPSLGKEAAEQRLHEIQTRTGKG
ncbi:hypothetical protein C5Y96_23775 [Blastopirellula marina]|uniref:Uncharacterized protein n=1 Tax=Blastopirellula marina TaxID=124 RepID=A0A2S8F0C1_9BACT|nr:MULTISPECIES: DUF6714 family protein [Pirellulaceae]PQO25364.1 hypothetical protein C5Y96_23775 [Blastopirellula marina]RCS42328.1 hypothetical protein DTL36_23825 [Bremerella cremea]